MLRSRLAFPPCWNWAPVRSALSLWQGTIMLWGYLEPQEGQIVQWVVWVWGLCVTAAPPGTMSSTRPQRTVRVGRSTVQDLSESPACILSPTLSWSRKVSQPATTPSTSRTCQSMLPLFTQAAWASLLMWPQLLTSEGGCWGWMEIWWSAPMWSRDVGEAWSSRGTLSKRTRLIRYTAHHRHDARSGSEYDANINKNPGLCSLSFTLLITQGFILNILYISSKFSLGLFFPDLHVLIVWRNSTAIQLHTIICWTFVNMITTSAFYWNNLKQS